MKRKVIFAILFSFIALSSLDSHALTTSQREHLIGYVPSSSYVYDGEYYDEDEDRYYERYYNKDDSQYYYRYIYNDSTFYNGRYNYGIFRESNYDKLNNYSKTIYRFEDTYTKNDRKHYVTVEYYYQNNDKVYSVYDYYYDSNDKKIYDVNVTQRKLSNSDLEYYLDNYLPASKYTKDDERYRNYYRDRYYYRNDIFYEDSYRRHTINNKTTYVYDDSYYDRNDYRHYVSIEYYYESGKKVYTVQDYYYKNNSRKYLVDVKDKKLSDSELDDYLYDYLRYRINNDRYYDSRYDRYYDDYYNGRGKYYEKVPKYTTEHSFLDRLDSIPYYRYRDRYRNDRYVNNDPVPTTQEEYFAQKNKKILEERK